MKVSEINVFTNQDHLRLFKNKAWEYRNDWEFISKVLPVSEILEFTKNNYILVEGEQLIRPIHFYKVGADCDAQLVFLLSYFYFTFGRSIENLLRFVIIDFKNGGAHIYLEFQTDSEIISFDALPPKYHYTKNDIDKITKINVSEL